MDRPITASLALACAVAPAVAPARDQPLLTRFQTSVDDLYVRPFARGDVARWLELFADDAVALHNRMPAAEGKAAIRRFGDFVAQNVRIERMSVTLDGVRVSGDTAWTWGRYDSRLVLRANGQPLPGHAEQGKVLFVWQRQRAGDWKIVVDMGNDLPPPQR